MLLKFFLNSRSEAYLRSLAEEFGESTNSIRLELNKFEDAGLLTARMQGNKKLYKANSSHPLFPDIHNIILKHVGVDHIIEEIVNKLGDVHKVFLIGDFAKGINSSIMDLIFVGRDINKTYLLNLVEKAEKIIKRKLRFMVFEPDEFEDYKNNIKNEEPLLLWQSE
ncbi:MAG: winged helix-turn-helix domain-containing protein [Bacteroidales bacterium]|nr:winged helix-turn-helix domain-containing protein [Bacteroidales bacterium]MCF8328074.1 winged helix-turn-helix domain-containing protein [Bacteroidales bacterium]